MRLQMALAGGAVVAAATAAALPVTAVYAGGHLPALLGAAATGGAGVAACARALRRSPAVALLISVVVMGGAVVAIGGWLPRPPGPWLAASVTAVANSGAGILTSAVPVPLTLQTVALPVGAAWLTASASVLLLSTGRPATAALPPMALFAGAVALAGPPSAPAYRATAALAAALVVLLGVLGRSRVDRAFALRCAGFAVVFAGVTGWLGPAVLGATGRQPPDPRAHVVPPYQQPQQLNPLSLLSGWAADPERSLLEVRSDRPARLRWVTLPEFTGVTWLPAPEYRAAGAVLGPAPEPGSTAVHQEISITGLAGGWLPVPDGAREVRGVRVAVDAGSGTVAAPDGLGPAVRYTVTAVPPVWVQSRLAEARLPGDEAFDSYRSLPAGDSGRLSELARTAAGTGSPYQQARRLADHLREHYRFDPTAPGGNGYPSVQRFLFHSPAQGGGRGTSEQFATAFAVLARALAMPVRVAVGFDPGRAMGSGRYVVRAGDALAWPEVYLSGAGWVPFDPTPPSSTVDVSGGAAPPPASPTPSVAPEPDDGDRTDDPEPADDAARVPHVDAPRGGRRAALSATVGGVLLVVLGTVALRVRRGTVAVRRGAPAARVLAAWTELRHSLRLAGHAPAAALVVTEVAGLAAAAAGERWRGDAPALAAVVNTAGFDTAALQGSDADRVAQQMRALRRALRRGAGPRRRLTWWIDPRPLWWR
ncbi:transglutaminase domain-containing protein [Dactylosporangium roseum]|uniref:Transglutaminase domain-containing protein n=1 Tax=Dactylosporangium roseum TaxID=47989 RepID=A0ABY5YXH2_9ACTN|nr:transglutaminaseTgpA domain-containing protein [Dactylosporangium roseum]UWZ34451.1 transglutaminase domain-containing protein [Dactylosporangium roseum]